MILDYFGISIRQILPCVIETKRFNKSGFLSSLIRIIIGMASMMVILCHLHICWLHRS